MRPELVRSGWFNTMIGKSLRKIGRDRHGKQHKKSVYMGGGGSGKELVDLETGLETNRICTGEHKV
jgi:hypothetical protein